MPFQEPGRDGREAGRPLTRDDGVPSERQRRGWHRDLTEEGIEPQPGPSRRASWRQRILVEAILDLGIIILSGFAWVGDYLAGLAVQLLPAPPRALDSEAEEEVERQAAQLEDFEPGPGGWRRNLTQEGSNLIQVLHMADGPRDPA